MNSIDLKYLITALVDNEISDEKTRNSLLEKINSDRDLRFDYLVQQRIKSLVSGSKVQSTPEKVKSRIIRKIRPSGFLTTPLTGGNINLTPHFWVYSTAAVILIAVLLVIFNRPPMVEISDTAAAKNMLLEANSNFSKIKSGDIKPQFVSNNPEEINNFFRNEGIIYSTTVPAFASLNLVGAVISEEKGYKLAHHVYTSEKNELVYVFQVSAKYFDDNIMSLPDDIKQNIELNNCYSKSDDGVNSLFTIIDNNVFAVVSDLSVNEIESLFCSIN